MPHDGSRPQKKNSAISPADGSTARDTTRRVNVRSIWTCPLGFLPMEHLEWHVHAAWEDGARPAWLDGGPPLVVDGKLTRGLHLKRVILLYFGPDLASGRLRAAGIDQASGEVVWIPSETWRLNTTVRSNGPETSALEAALDGDNVHTSTVAGPSRCCVPLLTWVHFKKMMAVDSVQPPPSVEPIELLPNGGALKAGIETRGPVSKGPSHPGGRQPSHDWDAFWIEVAWYAAKHDLEIAHRPKLQRHMLEWTGKHSKTPPDEGTIRKKLKELFAGQTPPN